MVVLFSCVHTILLLLATAFVAIQGYQHNPVDAGTSLLGFRYDDEVGFNSKREPGKNVMWIGPRLGRRKRSEDDTVNSNSNLPDKNAEAVMEFLQDTPWAFVALKGTKRRTVNFIPRLGRDSEEDFADGGLEGSFSKSRGGSQIARPFGGGNNFTPRLGRFATAGLYNRDRL